MNVAGIDYDTHGIYIVTLSPDRGRAASSLTMRSIRRKGDAFERMRGVVDVMPRGTFWDEVLAVAIEEPMVMNPKLRQLLPKLKAVQGAIVALLPPDMMVVPMTPNVWRKKAGLPGNAPKERIAKFVVAHERAADDVRFWPQDGCDAFCLALALENESNASPFSEPTMEGIA